MYNLKISPYLKNVMSESYFKVKLLLYYYFKPTLGLGRKTF